jgi:hypothetical protein
MGSAAPAPSGGFFPLPDPSKTHPENTTVFIGGLPPSVGRTELGALFEAFGEIIYVGPLLEWLWQGAVRCHHDS